MQRYNIYCTEEQTKKALELGAPIDKVWGYNTPFANTIVLEKYVMGNNTKLLLAVIPTAEQMICWLEEQKKIDNIEIQHYCDGEWESDLWLVNAGYIEHRGFSSRKKATLAAIDAALDYLTENKK